MILLRKLITTAGLLAICGLLGLYIYHGDWRLVARQLQVATEVRWKRLAAPRSFPSPQPAPVRSAVDARDATQDLPVDVAVGTAASPDSLDVPADADPAPKPLPKAPVALAPGDDPLLSGLFHTTSAEVAAPSVPTSVPAPRSVPEVTVETKLDTHETTTVATEFFWHPLRVLPEALLERLDQLTQRAAYASWAQMTAGKIRAAASSSNPAEALQAVTAQLAEAEPWLESSDDQATVELRLAHHALKRWTDVMRSAVHVRGRQPVVRVLATVDGARLQTCLADIKSLTADDPEGPGWRHYLLIEPLEQLAAETASEHDDRARKLAHLVINRLHWDQLDSAQRAFVASSPLAKLDAELEDWVAEPVDVTRLVERINDYELTGSDRHGRWLAAATRRLQRSSDEDTRVLGQWLESHYRHLNVRVAVTQQLLQRFMPDASSSAGPVAETILGRPVRGTQLTYRQLGLRMIPEERRITLSIIANGQIDSRTFVETGMATFYTAGDTTFQAELPLELDRYGIRHGDPEVDVLADDRLRRVRTGVDPLPVVGSLARGLAISQHAANRDDARREAERKVAVRVGQRLQQEVEERLADARGKYQERIALPLSRLGLDPELINTSTTDSVASARGRIATADQLGSHTPRPRALVNSWASLQMHETAWNNLADSMQLEGRQLTVAETVELIRSRLGVESGAELAEEANEIQMKFSRQTPLRLDFAHDQVLVTLTLDEVDTGRDRVSDVLVKIPLSAQRNGRSAELVREEAVQIAATTGLRSRLMLRAIFSKAFSRNRPFVLIPQSWLDDPRLNDLLVTQFVVRDGWIGISIGQQGDSQQMAAQPGMRTSALR